MRGVFVRVAVLVAVAAFPAVALAAGSSKPWVTSNCKSEHYKPKTIIVACADASDRLHNLKWSSWGARNAMGKGTLTYNTCVPNCASGHNVSFSVKVTLSKVKSCRGHKHKIFSHAALSYIGKQPKHADKSLPLFCPI